MNGCDLIFDDSAAKAVIAQGGKVNLQSREEARQKILEVFERETLRSSGIEIKLIQGHDIEKVQQLAPGELAFPDVAPFEFQPLEDSPRLRGTIKAQKTILSNEGYGYIVDAMEKGREEDIPKQMVWLEHFIDQLIAAYPAVPPSAKRLVLKVTCVEELIFHLIQLWGGRSGRTIYLRGGGFEENFDLEKYREWIRICRTTKDPVKLCDPKIKIDYIGISFASKHWKFWSAHQLPIYDSILAKGLYGRKIPQFSEYPGFVDAMEALVQALGKCLVRITVGNLERSLFNFFNSEEGAAWLEARESSEKS